MKISIEIDLQLVISIPEKRGTTPVDNSLFLQVGSHLGRTNRVHGKTLSSVGRRRCKRGTVPSADEASRNNGQC